MRLREAEPTDPDRDPLRVIRTVLDRGVRMIDTADAYANEELVGRAIRPHRDGVTLASKFGLVRSPTARGFTVRADPRYVGPACEASLRRLGVDVIDLYYLHHRSDDTPIEETVGAMSELVRQGKVRGLGLSSVTAEDLRRAHVTHPISALQERWALSDRSIETSLLPVARTLGIAIVAHSPTSHGALHHLSEPSSTATIKAALANVAARSAATPGQVALAWVHHRASVHGTTVIPLPGTTRVDHARANIAARDLHLESTDLHLLDEASELGGGE